MATITDDAPANARRALAPDKPDAERFLTCPRCGQRIDTRRLAEVLHHAEPGHEPVKTERPAEALKFIPPLLPTLSEES